jgi:hypothetical protein
LIRNVALLIEFVLVLPKTLHIYVLLFTVLGLAENYYLEG